MIHEITIGRSALIPTRARRRSVSGLDSLGLDFQTRSLHPRSLCRRDREALKRLNIGSPSFAHSHIHDAHHDHQHEDEKSARAAGGQADDHSGGELFRCTWRRGRRGRLGAGKNGRGQNGDPVFAARPSQISMGRLAGTRARDRGGGGGTRGVACARAVLWAAREGGGTAEYVRTPAPRSLRSRQSDYWPPSLGRAPPPRHTRTRLSMSHLRSCKWPRRRCSSRTDARHPHCSSRGRRG